MFKIFLVQFWTQLERYLIFFSIILIIDEQWEQMIEPLSLEVYSTYSFIKKIYGLIEKRQLFTIDRLTLPTKNHKSAKTSILSGLFLNADHEERTTDAGYESLRIFNTCKSDFLWRPFCLVILHNGLIIRQNSNIINIDFKLNSWK